MPRRSKLKSNELILRWHAILLLIHDWGRPVPLFQNEMIDLSTVFE